MKGYSPTREIQPLNKQIINATRQFPYLEIKDNRVFSITFPDIPQFSFEFTIDKNFPNTKPSIRLNNRDFPTSLTTYWNQSYTITHIVHHLHLHAIAHKPPTSPRVSPLGYRKRPEILARSANLSLDKDSGTSSPSTPLKAKLQKTQLQKPASVPTKKNARESNVTPTNTPPTTEEEMKKKKFASSPEYPASSTNDEIVITPLDTDSPSPIMSSKNQKENIPENLSGNPTPQKQITVNSPTVSDDEEKEEVKQNKINNKINNKTNNKINNKTNNQINEIVEEEEEINEVVKERGIKVIEEEEEEETNEKPFEDDDDDTFESAVNNLNRLFHNRQIDIDMYIKQYKILKGIEAEEFD